MPGEISRRIKGDIPEKALLNLREIFLEKLKTARTNNSNSKNVRRICWRNKKKRFSERCWEKFNVDSQWKLLEKSLQKL